MELHSVWRPAHGLLDDALAALGEVFDDQLPIRLGVLQHDGLAGGVAHVDHRILDVRVQLWGCYLEKKKFQLLLFLFIFSCPEQL